VGKLLCFKNEAGYNKQNILMQQKTTALMSFEKYAIGLVVFVFLFGFGGEAFAVTCASLDGNSKWQKGGTIKCDITYKDPTGGSNLAVCKYRVLSNGGETFFGDASGVCGENEAILQVNISVGSGFSCKDNGEDACAIEFYVEDNAGNSGEGLITTLDIDYLPPSGGSISYTNGSIDATFVVLTVNDGTDDPGSGINTSTRTVQRKSATLSDGTCGTYELFANVSVTGTYPSFTNSGLTLDNCYQYQYLVQDDLGHKATYTSLSVVKVDIVVTPTPKPTITNFNITSTLPITTVNPILNIDWGATSSLGPDLKEAILWRKLSSQGPEGWAEHPDPTVSPKVASGSSDSGTFSETFDLGIEATYDYGIHVKDQANKECNENDIPCGDAVSTLSNVKIDTIRPPKPTCTDSTSSPNAISVTCSDTEASVEIWYTTTTNGTDPPDPSRTTPSTKYTGVLTFTQTTMFKAAAWDVAGNGSLSPHNSYVYTITDSDDGGDEPPPDTIAPPTPTPEPTPAPVNQVPSISLATDSPDPIAADTSLTFEVAWSDPNTGDQTKIHICKTDSISGQTCAGGSWCDLPSFSSSSPSSCSYTTQVQDAGTNNYFAFVCDDENACSSSQSGSFDVDATAPTILNFDVNPKKSDGLWVSTANPSVTINWHVKDDGANDSGLQEVQVWQSSNGGVDWAQISGSPFIAPSNDWTGSATDSPASGDYLYGMHVKDNAGNEITETEAGFNIVNVQVDKDNPITVVSEPQDSTWWREDFDAVFEDVDPVGGSGLLSCEYEYYDLVSGIGSGVQVRSCGSSVETIVVGPSPKVCRSEGFNLCEVRTSAVDQAGNFAESFANFGVDYTDPSVGIPSPNIAQAGIPQTFTTLVSDNVSSLSGCSFFWKESSSSLWSSPIATSITPDECGAVQDCIVSVNHTFLSSGNYDIMFGCADFAQPDPPNTGYGSRDVLVESLSVTLSADPVSGSINTKFDLSSQVAGTTTGNANFKFDCTNDAVWEYEVDDINLSLSDPGWVTRQGEKTKVTAPDTFAVKDLCQYASSSIYTANALVERGTSSAQDTASIDVDTNNPPQAIDLKDNNSTADFCFVSAPPITLSWTFSDLDPGDNQSAYQVQVATNPGFGSPFIDTGKVLSANSEFSPLNLSFATTYHWRVKVWDNLDEQSVPEWATGTPLITPAHAFPNPDFTWSPSFPSAEEEVTFQDTTTFVLGSSSQSWAWDFGDTATSTLQNPTHVYQENGAYAVTLSATDDAGSCQAQKTVNTTLPFPDWREISPF